MEHTCPVRADPGAATERVPCLVVLRGREAGRVIALGSDPCILGRGDRAQVRLSDPGISREHARVRVRSERLLIEDLGSTNGVLCHGRRIRQALLGDGDCVMLGDCLLAFRRNHPDEGRLLRRLYHRATRDMLTGLFNRQSFEDRLGREVEREQRYRHGLSLVFLDLDHFKRINDTHGHRAGDRVLAAVARLLHGALRVTDFAARIGGEELVALLPECPRERAVEVAEKIRARIEAHKIPLDGKLLRVTASLGVSSLDSPRMSAADLLSEADAACYRAKREGRNRVMAAERKSA
jgi:diguanylate cyclase (GGDEF)-like protein